jgi:hypothetical protein
MRSQKCMALLIMPSQHEKYCGVECPCHDLSVTHPEGFCSDHPCPVMVYLDDREEKEEQETLSKEFINKKCDKCSDKATVILRYKFETHEDTLCAAHTIDIAGIRPTRGQYVIAHVNPAEDGMCRNREMKEFIDSKGGPSYIKHLMETQPIDSALVPESYFNYTSLDVFGKDMPVNYGPGQNTIFLRDEA